MTQAQTIKAAVQRFEHGRMFWLRPSGDIWDGDILVLIDSGQVHRFTESVYSTWPNNDHMVSPLAPRYGIGKVWFKRIDIRDALGSSTDPEEAITLSVRNSNGILSIYIPGQTVMRIHADGSWTQDDGPALPPVIDEPPIDPDDTTEIPDEVKYITVADHKRAMDELRAEMLEAMDDKLAAHVERSLTLKEVADGLLLGLRTPPNDRTNTTTSASMPNFLGNQKTG